MVQITNRHRFGQRLQQSGELEPGAAEDALSEWDVIQRRSASVEQFFGRVDQSHPGGHTGQVEQSLHL